MKEYPYTSALRHRDKILLYLALFVQYELDRSSSKLFGIPQIFGTMLLAVASKNAVESLRLDIQVIQYVLTRTRVTFSMSAPWQ